MELSLDAQNLIALLNDNGYKAYAVGGCVRDSIMGLSGGDIDITSSASPNQLITLLESNGIRYIETGLKHGTVTALVNGVTYEITTFRTEGAYLDNRHPSSVEFVDDISLDLARRDFTINAMAYNDREGLVDLYGGQADINSKLIRAVGNADTRFKEDALRIMRALRFSAYLGFDIEKSTEEAMFDNKELLLNIAPERLFVELKKMLCSKNIETVLTRYRDILAVIIPELKPCFDFPQITKWHIYDVYTHIVKSVALSDNDFIVRLTLLLHDIAKPKCCRIDDRGIYHFKGHPAKSEEMADTILRRFKVSNEILNTTKKLVRIHDYKISDDVKDIKRWLNRYGVDITLYYIKVRNADLLSHNPKYTLIETEQMKRAYETLISVTQSGEAYSISQLDINGFDLMKIGFKGKAISLCLDYLLSLVIENPEYNNKAKLILLAEKYKGNSD